MTLTKNFLRRYTDLPALIHLLTTQSITFLDPSSWDDKNDAYFMSLYKEKKGLTSLLAICCSMETETYHHWRVFSNGPSGVCISFKRKMLVETLEENESVRTGEVLYQKINDLKASDACVDDMPFLKRAPYSPEHEFRFVYESRATRLHAKSYPIPLASIERIYLSPWMPEAVAESVKSSLREIPGVGSISIARSTLIRNDDWKEYGDRLVTSKR
ncbi:MAG TPA: hypothetical protein VMB19_06760 [Silvibacterium sp.]|nr:hypothetical protein [Silvibacterium sp.]